MRPTNKDYKRAWQIINHDEGYLPFLDELKAAPKGSVDLDLEI